MIAVNAILNGTDDSHGSDTYRQGGRHKTADKLIVTIAAGLMLEPLAETLKLRIQINEFSQQCPQCQ